MPDNEMHVGWIKTLDPKYQSLFYGFIFTLFFPLKTISRVWFYCERLLVECFNFQLILLKFFIVLCFYDSKSRGFHCRANLYGGVYMTPGRLSRQSEFTQVPSHGSTFVYMIPPQNVMPARLTPA